MQMLEAFRALNALNEDIFSLDAEGVDKLSNFTQNDDLEDDVQIIDPEAETEEELQDNYIGKVILDCCVCHSKLYKDPAEVELDENGELANVGEECPYCFTPDGFKVIGEVVPFASKDEEDESEEPADDSEEEVNIEEEEDEQEPEGINESLTLTEGDELSGFLNNYSDKIIAIIKKIWPKNLTAAQVTEIKNNIRSLQGTAEGNKLDKVYRGINQKEPELKQQKPVEVNKGLKEAAFSGGMAGDNSIGGGTGPRSDYSTGDHHNATGYLKRLANKNNVKILTIKVKDLKPEMITDVGQVEKIENIGRDEVKLWYTNGVDERYSLNRDILVLADLEDTSKPSTRDYSELKRMGLKESINLDEAIEDLSMTANDTHIEVSEEDNGKVTVSMEPAGNDDGGEMVAPISAEMEAEIMSDEPALDADLEDSAVEAPEEDTSIDADFDEFDEDTMDGLGESYFRRVYENVNSFKTTAVKTSGNSLIIEGLLKFDSGNEKSTSFVFEALDATKHGKFRFIGDNKELTEGKKAFMLTGTINNNKLMVESMNYNYKHIDAEGKTSRVYGIERINKGE